MGGDRAVGNGTAMLSVFHKFRRRSVSTRCPALLPKGVVFARVSVAQQYLMAVSAGWYGV
jgi:hypothetical protein